MYDQARSRKSLVIDGTFYRQDIRSHFKKLADDLHVDLRWIEVKAEESLIQKRVDENRPHSDADFEIYKLIKKQYAPFTAPRLSLQSSNDNVDEMLKEAMNYLTASS